MDYSSLYAARIGGPEFGSSGKMYKFAKIKAARNEFKRNHPDSAVIDMGVGEPEERAPDHVVETVGLEAARLENRIYADNGGSAFKEAAARYLQRKLGLSFNPEDEIIHCIGTKSALAILPFAFVNPGDVVVATVPGYPVLATAAAWLGAHLINVKLKAANSFLPDLEELEQIAQRRRPKLLLLNYPNNPTGAIAPLAFYERVVALARDYNFLIVQDAAYADFVHQGVFVSPLQVAGGKQVALELYSLSKSFNMQGWRLGFVVSCPEIIKAYAHVKDNTDSGQFLAIQKAGVAALDNCPDFTDTNRKKYARRLEKVAQILNNNGFTSHPSPSTFYLYCQVPANFHGRSFESAEALSAYLISQLGIVCVPWDEAGAFLRFSMTFELGGTSGFSDEEAVYRELERRLRPPGA